MPKILVKRNVDKPYLVKRKYLLVYKSKDKDFTKLFNTKSDAINYYADVKKYDVEFIDLLEVDTK